MDTPEMIAAEYLRRDIEIDISSAISRGWALVMANVPVLGGATVLTWAIGVGLGFLPIIGWAVGLLLGSVLHAGVLSCSYDAFAANQSSSATCSRVSMWRCCR